MFSGTISHKNWAAVDWSDFAHDVFHRTLHFSVDLAKWTSIRNCKTIEQWLCRPCTDDWCGTVDKDWQQRLTTVILVLKITHFVISVVQFSIPSARDLRWVSCAGFSPTSATKSPLSSAFWSPTIETSPLIPSRCARWSRLAACGSASALFCLLPKCNSFVSKAMSVWCLLRIFARHLTSFNSPLVQSYRTRPLKSWSYTFLLGGGIYSYWTNPKEASFAAALTEAHLDVANIHPEQRNKVTNEEILRLYGCVYGFDSQARISSFTDTWCNSKTSHCRRGRVGKCIQLPSIRSLTRIDNHNCSIKNARFYTFKLMD